MATLGIEVVFRGEADGMHPAGWAVQVRRCCRAIPTLTDKEWQGCEPGCSERGVMCAPALRAVWHAGSCRRCRARRCRCCWLLLLLLCNASMTHPLHTLLVQLLLEGQQQELAPLDSSETAHVKLCCC